MRQAERSANASSINHQGKCVLFRPGVVAGRVVADVDGGFALLVHGLLIPGELGELRPGDVDVGLDCAIVLPGSCLW